MRILVAVPQRPGTTSGNSVTGDRWARRLGELGHRAQVVDVVDTQAIVPERLIGIDLVVALHATRCAGVVEQAVECGVPVAVGLAGTDLYRDLPDDVRAMRSLRIARHLVVLQDDAIATLHRIEPAFAEKATVVHQSVDDIEIAAERGAETGITVAVLAHLRDVKDPLLTARASGIIPDSVQLAVEHAGSAHTERWADSARQAMVDFPRYRWLGSLERDATRRLLAGADVLACTSLLEGGANVVTEAIAHGVAVIGTDVGGNRGLLGNDHPGLVPVGDVDALADVLTRLAQPGGELLETLTNRSLERRWMTEPDHERSGWESVLDATLR